MSASILPAARPRLSSDALLERMAPYAIDRARHPIVVAGVRAYYRDTMGHSGANDRNLYDDAIFVHTSSAMVAFNGNTDASKVRRGWGILGDKGMLC
jgi:lysozyme